MPGTSLATRGMNIPAHDYVENTYDGSGRLSIVTYKSGGPTGQIVATQALTYDGNGNLLSITKASF
jgi:hypothetical protein